MDIQNEFKNFALINETIDLREEMSKLPTQKDLDLFRGTMDSIHDMQKENVTKSMMFDRFHEHNLELIDKFDNYPSVLTVKGWIDPTFREVKGKIKENFEKI